MRYLLSLCILALLLPLSAAQTHINPLSSDCWFTPVTELPTYNDLALSQPHLGQASLQAGRSLAVLEIADAATLVALDHARGFWVATDGGVFSGFCETVTDGPINTMQVLANTRLWSQPSVTAGIVLAELPTGASVTILSGAVWGPIRYDSSQVDFWYPVQAGSQVGWIWSGRLDFNNSLPEADAVALGNTRLWSQPDVVTGAVMLSVRLGAPLEIIGGPVSGRIRSDSLETGVWYQVRVEQRVGWVWAERLQFN